MASELNTPGFFTSALDGYENVNPFDRTYKDDNSSLDVSRQRYIINQNRMTNDVFSDGLNSDNFNQMFGFSPHQSPVMNSGNTTRHQNQYTDLDGMNLDPTDMWKPVKDEHVFGINGQPYFQPPPTPPSQSAQNSPEKTWNYFPQQRQQSPLDQIVTHNLPGPIRANRGQITPPDDENNSSNAVSSTLPADQPASASTESSSKKHKKAAQATQAAQPAASPKRRKGSTRSKPSSVAEDNPPEEAEPDEKRNKFLERNRVAASKCRQKKKQWTNNLESRARDLQNQNRHLTIAVGSLREEMLYLKGQVLKHNNCNCNSMREYLHREVMSISQNTANLQHRGSFPARSMSIGSTGGEVDQDSSLQSSRRSSIVGSTGEILDADRDLDDIISSGLPES